MLTMFWFCAAKVGCFFESTKYFSIKFALFFQRRRCAVAAGLQKGSRPMRKWRENAAALHMLLYQGGGNVEKNH
ncbi:hypothetical protein [Duncaniella sp.]|uniref:hypothetical protein n=1 Tax=Duncaniella sp. TaxID=2518496 RepID=UPI0023C2A4C5|nr:hypothetical protein [Duncaniella sp.]MDE5904032.1 hypothetical protein [Duncaniella sp.]